MMICAKYRFLAWCLIFFLIGYDYTGAATYHVATSGDNTTGADEAHAKTTIQAGFDLLTAGDTLIIHGGTYKEAVTGHSNFRGTSGNRITVINDTGETVTMDGTIAITGWTQCVSNEPGLTVQGVTNPNYANIYKATIATDQMVKTNGVVDLAKFNLFENLVYCRVCRTPDQVYGYGIDQSLFTDLVDDENWGQDDFLVDTTNLTQASDYWNGAFVDVFSHNANAWNLHRAVADFDRNTAKITFGSFTYTYPATAAALGYNLTGSASTPDAYSIWNHPHLVNGAGEYYITPTPTDGFYTVYLWPTNTGSLTSGISIQSKSNAIYVSYANRGDYVTIDGISVFGYQSNGIDIAGSSGTHSDSVIIQNCSISTCQGTGIKFSHCDNATVKDCTVTLCNGMGVQTNTGSNGTIDGCTISNTASTNASFYTMDHGVISDCHLYGCVGSHGNGVSAYVNSSEILIARNYFYNGANLAFQDITNSVTFANVFYGNEKQSTLVATWADSNGRTQGYHVYINNTILGSTNQSALSVRGQSAEPYPQNYVINNILDGLGGWAENRVINRTYNYYTDYSWNQEARYGWALGEGEQYDTTPLTSLFLDPDGDVYKLKDFSPAIGSGQSLTGILQQLGILTEFPDFDFTKDIVGKPWANPPSVGAYEYQPSPNNHAPVMASIGNKTVSAAQLLTFTVSATDSDGDTIRYSVTGLPQGATFNTTSGAFSWTPSITQIGNHSLTFTARDGKGGMDSETMIITVNDPTDNLRAYWKFNEKEGTVAQDSSDNNNTATLVNGPEWTNQSVFVDGSNDYVNAGTSTFDLAGQLTVAIRFNATGTLTNQQTLIQRGINAYPFIISLNGKTIQTCIRTTNGTDWFNPTTQIQADKWYNIALTYKSGERIVYVNGIKYVDPTPPTGNLVVSAGLTTTIANNGNNAGFFRGLIDEVRIYNSVKSVEDIFAIMNSIDGIENWLTIHELIARDLSGNPVTFSSVVAGLPKRAAFDPATNTLSWRPWYDQAGSYEMLFSAVTGGYTQKVTIDVEDVLLKTWYQDWINSAPVQTTMVDY